MLNIQKSKFMIVGNKSRLQNFTDMELLVEQEPLEKVTEFKYLGIFINQHLTWHDHVEMLQSKVSQRLGVLKRIKNLLPLYARKLYVTTLIVPLFDHASIVWGDKNNKVLMNLLQVLHSKAAKLILNQSFWSSSTEALEQLNLLTLSQRRELQRCVYMYTNLSGETLNFTKGRDLHEYNTRNKNMLRTFKSNTNWGLLRSHNSCLDRWNSLSDDIRSLSTIERFKKAARTFITEHS